MIKLTQLRKNHRLTFLQCALRGHRSQRWAKILPQYFEMFSAAAFSFIKTFSYRFRIKMIGHRFENFVIPEHQRKVDFEIDPLTIRVLSACQVEVEWAAWAETELSKPEPHITILPTSSFGLILHYYTSSFSEQTKLKTSWKPASQVKIAWLSFSKTGSGLSGLLPYSLRA